MPMLEIKNLSVAVDGQKILDGLNLAVNAGEVWRRAVSGKAL